MYFNLYIHILIKIPGKTLISSTLMYPSLGNALKKQKKAQISGMAHKAINLNDLVKNFLFLLKAHKGKTFMFKQFIL